MVVSNQLALWEFVEFLYCTAVVAAARFWIKDYDVLLIVYYVSLLHGILLISGTKEQSRSVVIALTDLVLLILQWFINLDWVSLPYVNTPQDDHPIGYVKVGLLCGFMLFSIVRVIRNVFYEDELVDQELRQQQLKRRRPNKTMMVTDAYPAEHRPPTYAYRPLDSQAYHPASLSAYS